MSCAVSHSCVDMNSGFRANVPVFGGSDTLTIGTMGTGPTTAISPNTFVPTAVLAPFQHPNHPELVHDLAPAPSLPAQSSPPRASPESADVEGSSEASHGNQESYYYDLFYARNGAPDEVTRLISLLYHMSR